MVVSISSGVGIFYLRLHVLLRLLFVEVSLDGVENAVDELRGFVRREAACDLESFVDRYRARRWLVKKFVDGEAQDIAIDDGHTRDTPVFGARTDAFVEQFEVGKRSRGEPGSELPGCCVEIGLSQLSPVTSDHFVRRHFGNVSRKEHLQGAFTRLTSRTHRITKNSHEKAQKN